MIPFVAETAMSMAPQIVGSILNRDAVREANYDARVQADREAARQKEFAQHGIQWKVEDARSAGIAPLAALGASTASYSPSVVGGTPDTSVGDAVSSMGQNISRAVMATQSKEERAYQNAMNAETLANARLKNQLLATQISFANQPSNPPMQSAMGEVIPGQGDSGFKIKPAEVTASHKGVPAREAGAINSYGFMRTNTGLAVVPSTDAKNRTEDDLIQQAQWAVRNQLLPMFKGLPAPSSKDFPLPPGADEWRWDPVNQEFRASKKGYGWTHSPASGFQWR